MRNPDGTLTVWVVEDDVAKMRIIKAQQALNDQWIVTEGLEDGEVIILEGYQKVAEGAKVKAVLATKSKEVVKESE